MVNSVVKVLVVELLVSSIKFSNIDAEPDHDVFVFHKLLAVVDQLLLLFNFLLARVEGTEYDRARGGILKKPSVCRAYRMFRKFGVEIVHTTVGVLLQLLLLQEVGELLSNEVLLLFVEDVYIGIKIFAQPGVTEDLDCGESIFDVLLEHLLH